MYFGFNSKKKFHPASTVKLITSFYALTVLGDSYKFKTEFFTVGKRNFNSFNGDLYIRGYGDPKLVYEDLQDIISEMRATGLKNLKGNFIVDDSYFAEPEVNSELFDGKRNKPYNVGPNASLLNFKAVELSVEKVGGQIKISLKPPLADFALVNHMKWVRGSCRRNKINYRESENQLRVYGKFGTRCKRRRLYLGLSTHNKFAFSLFKQAWIDSGGNFEQFLGKGIVPKTANLLYSWTNPRNLGMLIKDINTLSNNTMARTMFLNLSAIEESPGSLFKSRRIVSNWLEAQGIDKRNVYIDNGSGLSRTTRLSTEDLNTILLAATKTDKFSVWKNSLSTAGKEGTTLNRFRGMGVTGNAWLKTGSLEDVQAYAGYVLTEKKRWLAFAVVVNHAKAERARKSLDKFINSLYTDKRQ